jgi:hypothetical protein
MSSIVNTKLPVPRNIKLTPESLVAALEALGFNPRLGNKTIYSLFRNPGQVQLSFDSSKGIPWSARAFEWGIAWKNNKDGTISDPVLRGDMWGVRGEAKKLGDALVALILENEMTEWSLALGLDTQTLLAVLAELGFVVDRQVTRTVSGEKIEGCLGSINLGRHIMATGTYTKAQIKNRQQMPLRATRRGKLEVDHRVYIVLDQKTGAAKLLCSKPTAKRQDVQQTIRALRKSVEEVVTALTYLLQGFRFTEAEAVEVGDDIDVVLIGEQVEEQALLTPEQARQLAQKIKAEPQNAARILGITQSQAVQVAGILARSPTVQQKLFARAAA